jgi:hypothetical protein
MDNQLKQKFADNNFKIFSVCDENNVDYLRSIYQNKTKLQEYLRFMFDENNPSDLNSTTKIDLFCLLTEYIFEKCIGIAKIEICALYLIFDETLKLSLLLNSKIQIFNFFRDNLIKFSIDRPPNQIGILSKLTIEKIADFFIDNFLKRFELMKYMLTTNEEIELSEKEILEVKFPHVLSLEMASEILPRNSKILRQYTENKKPKTELEQKIEQVLEFEREIMDKKMEAIFTVQDQNFNKKLEELLKKKK